MEREMTDRMMAETKGGEAITLAAIMAILSIAIVTVVVYRIFRSANGSSKITLPGGFVFQW